MWTPVPDVQVELDHLLGVQLLPADVDEDVGPRRQRRRQLDDHARVEPLQRLLGVHAVRLVALVEDDQRPQQPQRVPKRRLDLPPPDAPGPLEGVQVRRLPQQLRVFCGTVLRREEPVEPPGVPVHPKPVLRLPVGGRKHEEEDAEVLLDIPRTEGRRLLEHAGALAGRQVKLLPVGMIAILEGPQRLIVDLGRGNDPEHQPPPPVQEPPVDQIDHPRGQQRLPAPGRDLQAERGERVAHPGAPGAVGTADPGVAPGPPDPVHPPVGILLPGRLVLPPPPREPLHEVPDGRHRPLLVLLEDHPSSSSMGW